MDCLEARASSDRLVKQDYPERRVNRVCLVFQASLERMGYQDYLD